jgi:hypothetical protein
MRPVSPIATAQHLNGARCPAWAPTIAWTNSCAVTPIMRDVCSAVPSSGDTNISVYRSDDDPSDQHCPIQLRRQSAVAAQRRRLPAIGGGRRCWRGLNSPYFPLQRHLLVDEYAMLTRCYRHAYAKLKAGCVHAHAYVIGVSIVCAHTPYVSRCISII